MNLVPQSTESIYKLLITAATRLLGPVMSPTTPYPEKEKIIKIKITLWGTLFFCHQRPTYPSTETANIDLGENGTSNYMCSKNIHRPIVISDNSSVGEEDDMILIVKKITRYECCNFAVEGQL